jgi:hypothetical protein
VLRERYRHANRKERSAILDLFLDATGCIRKYAVAVLTGKRSQKMGSTKRRRISVHGAEEVQALLALSDLLAGISSKRLRSATDIELPRLYLACEIDMSPRCYENMMRISPSNRRTGPSSVASLATHAMTHLSSWTCSTASTVVFTTMATSSCR